MKKTIIFLLLTAILAIAEDYNIATQWTGAGSTAWFIDGNNVYPIEVAGKSVCHYAGRVVLPSQNGRCPSVSIRHLAKMVAEYEGEGSHRTWQGLRCYYDYNVDGNGYHWIVQNLRQTCPDILVSVIAKGSPKVVKEIFFNMDENQASYYKRGEPIEQGFTTEAEVIEHFGKIYKQQVEYRNNYDWVRCKPMPYKPRSSTWN